MSEEQAQQAAPSALGARRRKWLPTVIVLGAAAALHVALLLYFAPPRLMLSTTPVSVIDYSLHYHQVDRARRAFAGWGKLWSYDPQLLAGQPAGAIEDLSSKSVELFVIALERLGFHPALAFNLYILLVHLLVPFIGYLAARLFAMTRLQAAVAMLLWVLLWHFDSFLHWAWFCGMISWSLVSALAVLLVALVYRATASGPPALWVAISATTALLVLVHPFGVAIAVVPCAALYLRGLRRHALATHLGVALTVAAGVATSLVWLPPALRVWHYVMDSSNFLIPGPQYLLYDYLDLLKEPWHTGGGPVRTLLRTLCLACAAVMLWRWGRARDGRTLPLALMIGSMMLLAYCGGLLWVTRQVQPYRHVMPAALAAALPAAVLLVEHLSPRALRGLGAAARLLLILALLLILPRLAQNILYYLPDALPIARKPVPGRNPGDPPPEPLTGLYNTRPPVLRHAGPEPAHLKVREWLQANHRGRGRVLVQDWIMGEYLAWATDIPIIGGLDERNVHHMDAHLFRWHPDGNLTGEKLREYLERYAIGFVVMRTYKPALEWRKDLLVFRGLVAGCRIYETRTEPSYFARGKGRVAHQGLNTIRVEEAAGPEVVLRFHWMETLRCRPGCAVERHAVPGDRVGFIRVARPPARFEIYNSYEFAPRGGARLPAEEVDSSQEAPPAGA